MLLFRFPATYSVVNRSEAGCQRGYSCQFKSTTMLLEFLADEVPPLGSEADSELGMLLRGHDCLNESRNWADMCFDQVLTCFELGR